MTLKQKKFADEYIATGNAYQSALKAGYSENYAKGNAIKLLENVSVKAYIDKRLKEIEKDSIATADEVLQVLTSIIRREFIEERQDINPLTGEIMTLENKPTTKDVISASKELLKRYPTNVELKKVTAEIEKLYSQTQVLEQQLKENESQTATDNITIVDSWTDDGDDDDSN